MYRLTILPGLLLMALFTACRPESADVVAPDSIRPAGTVTTPGSTTGANSYLTARIGLRFPLF